MNATVTRTAPRLTSVEPVPQIQGGRRPTAVESATLFRFHTHIVCAGNSVRDLTLDPERHEKAEVLAERLEELAIELRAFARELG